MQKDIRSFNAWSGKQELSNFEDSLSERSFLEDIESETLKPFLKKVLERLAIQQLEFFNDSLQTIISHCATRELRVLICALALIARENKVDVVFKREHSDRAAPIESTLSDNGYEKLEIQLSESGADLKLMFSYGEYPDYKVTLTISIQMLDALVVVPCDDPSSMPAYSWTQPSQRINDDVFECAQEIFKFLNKKLYENIRLSVSTEELN